MADRPLQDPARRAAEDAVRNAYGRILALLAIRSGNLAIAEDALAEALARALEAWPQSGVPDKPEAWLLTTARRLVIDTARKKSTETARQADVRLLLEEGEAAMTEADSLPDERLKLLFVCTHPAIEPGMQAPLMLQTVLGLDASRIASAFLVRPATMSQRLVRQKSALKTAGAAFDIPDRGEWPQRLNAVLQAIYGAYNAGWDDHADASLAGEALFLASLINKLLPFEAEAAGLMSLILHCEARRDARRDEAGRFVPLDQQDATRWDEAMIAEAERLLGTALRMGNTGRFQLEAALQSAHAARRITGRTNWAAILAIYDRLIAVSPALGARVGRAAAIGRNVSPEAGLAALDDLPGDRTAQYQPYWATRAHLEALRGNMPAAQKAYHTAIGLTSDSAVRNFLLTRLAEPG